MKTTIEKLRALHEEVCHCWRNHHLGCTSAGEAEVLNLGFLMLERIVRLGPEDRCESHALTTIIKNEAYAYIARVYAQFDTDADIHITEVPHNE